MKTARLDRVASGTRALVAWAVSSRSCSFPLYCLVCLKFSTIRNNCSLHILSLPSGTHKALPLQPETLKFGKVYISTAILVHSGEQSGQLRWPQPHTQLPYTNKRIRSRWSHCSTPRQPLEQAQNAALQRAHVAKLFELCRTLKRPPAISLRSMEPPPSLSTALKHALALGNLSAIFCFI